MYTYMYMYTYIPFFFFTLYICTRSNAVGNKCVQLHSRDGQRSSTMYTNDAMCSSEMHGHIWRDDRIAGIL